MVHVPVMLSEVIEGLALKPGGAYLDGTVGAGGHSEKILEKAPGGIVVGVDRDATILEKSKEHLKRFGDRVHLKQGSYQELKKWSALTPNGLFDGMLLDLGVSSWQIDQGERGFSFQQKAKLDMRMNRSEGSTAKELLEELSEKAIADILWRLGEERFSRRIASGIKQALKQFKLKTTLDLKEVVERSVPRAAWPKKIDVATKTFQALRIAVNKELDRLEKFLGAFSDFLNPGGRIVVLSYHSLEDRLVKHAFREGARMRALQVITKKPVSASDEEIEQNPRARSAKMRVAEKMG